MLNIRSSYIFGLCQRLAQWIAKLLNYFETLTIEAKVI